MELALAVRTRRMVRNYDPKRPVPREVVNALLSLAVRAPSAGHTQGWHFLVLDDITSCSAFWTATTNGLAPNSWLTGMRTAPVLVVCWSDKQAYLDRYAEPDKGWTDRDENRWPVPYWHLDAGMAAMILLLGAVDAGLGACFFGVPPERWTALRHAFAVPEGLSPVGVVSLGHPAAGDRALDDRALDDRGPERRSPSLRRGRRAFTEMVSYGSFG